MKPSPARPTSVFEHASYLAMESTMVAESSTSHRKRRSITTSALASPCKIPIVNSRPFKLVREATPIGETSADAFTEPEQVIPNASTAPAENPTAIVADEETSGQFLPDDERHEQVMAETSEKEEPSVLFSEQEGTRTEPTEAIADSALLDEENESTVVAEPGVKVSQGRAVRRDSAVKQRPDLRESHQQEAGDGEVNEEDYADLPWMKNTSDGTEDLEQWMDPQTRQPEWDEHLRTITDDRERDRLIHHQRHLARLRKEKYLDANPGVAKELNYYQTTREQWEEGLAEELEIDYHSGDTEDFEMDHRPVLERTGVKRDIRAFTDSVDVLAEEDESKRDYQVIDRLGEGKSACTTSIIDSGFLLLMVRNFLLSLPCVR